MSQPPFPPLNVTALLRRYGVFPDPRLGQNFLLDESALARIVQAAEISPADAVLEIGPGLGSLTRRLAAAARQVVAVELDERLLPPLREVLHAFDNVTLVSGDILALDPADLLPEGAYLVAANIPYNITSALLRHLLESRRRPERFVLTVQREVAERICAGPGDLSLLALSVQLYGAPAIRARLPAGAFYPVPKVDSAVVRVDLYPEPRLPAARIELFFRVAKAGFSQKRKMLRNALAGGLHLEPAHAAGLLKSAGIDPRRRAETLSLEEWQTLTDIYAASAPD